MSDLSVTSTLTIPAHELEWSAVRASGPGGQNVNKVATKVELRFDLANSAVLSPAVKQRLRALARKRLDSAGRVVVTDQSTRVQSQNLERARAKLAELVKSALTVPKARKPTRPSRAAKRRRLEHKQQVSEKKRTRRKPSSED
ncbi:MAG TPA: alternative ribosome rescue aminoacyl-tRNA hydrolase ArfB [Polyangiaceae bacterium]|nr:alternative ribosome rescue aminoacyl-tRNA hydrolase ArfB [Polyangiaceae bacterium]